MGHPRIENSTSFAAEPLFVADADGRPIVSIVLKATFRFDAQGLVSLDDEQRPVNFEGEKFQDNPDGSYKYEPETAFTKPATDVVLIGHAVPPHSHATQVDVGIRVGPVQRLARVFGDRYWVVANGVPRVSRTGELDSIPLVWENAFGGRDERNSDADHPRFEVRNPVGTGFGAPLQKEGDLLKLPNIEDPSQLITTYGTAVQPCGFGFVSPNWQPRASLAGTYDDAWMTKRKPLLPLDFDLRFFNAAAPGLIAPGYLAGGEEVIVLNTAAGARAAFRLPVVPQPTATVAVRRLGERTLDLNLDTVVVDTDDMRLTQIWRGYTPCGTGPLDVDSIRIGLAR